MAKQSNQKLKILYLMRYLSQHTDEAHPASRKQIEEHLAKNGIPSERKSFYSDIEALRLFGLDIVYDGKGYYMATREFELPELKLLVDSVQAFKFITEKKTNSLIQKLEKQASEHEARFLQRQVYVRGRVKNMNESVYLNVDAISSAIAQDSAIRFRYYQYGPDKRPCFRRDGAFYQVSPFTLLWDNENYYMVAWDAGAGKLKHYRVDKMEKIAATGEKRQGKEAYEKVDQGSYLKKTFGMFTGEEKVVRIRFENQLMGAVIDRFGWEVPTLPDGPDHFTARVAVVESPQFYAWVFSFGTAAEILSPEPMRQRMKERAAEILGRYP
ncbi:MAG: WYL domain-containing protein [Oscillospiraceae bacterium]|nr:WYL domain-containing protein [Oscillospiraceae bacterium]